MPSLHSQDPDPAIEAGRAGPADEESPASGFALRTPLTWPHEP